MDYSLLWKAGLIVLGGTFLLRIAGRKSISQMTLAQTVIMIGIGSLLVQPITGRNVWATLAVGLSLVASLFLLELAQVKFDFVEKLITGRSKVLISNGTLNDKTLLKLRMTVDQLEMQLRQKSVAKMTDVEYATLEPNGQLGYVLKKDKQPVTQGDLNKVMDELSRLRVYMETRLPFPAGLVQPPITVGMANNSQSSQEQNKYPLFGEVENSEHEGNPPKRLQ